MSATSPAFPSSGVATFPVTKSSATKNKRIESIDLLRGTVMIIMALDHVRDYFHADALLYSPTDLSRTSVILFFTRWITHFCAPVFIFLAGVSAYLYGARRTKNELSFFLFTRGLWLIFAEVVIIGFIRTFNPGYFFINLQVIWAIGICMIILSVLIRANWYIILLAGVVLVGGHNLLDAVHMPGAGVSSFLWSVLHENHDFIFGRFTVSIFYPVLPWLGVMIMGYCLGSLYAPGYHAAKRKRTLLWLGFGAIALFIILRSGNFYGDAALWAAQKNDVFTFMSFLNVTKYPPSLQYVLVTLGPALIFLALTEKPLNTLTLKITIFGRVAMFYYAAHLFLIHLAAIGGAVISGYKWTDMILTTRVYASPGLKGYGFDLVAVYLVWILLILALYPLCKWFDAYKRANLSKHRWLSYI